MQQEALLKMQQEILLAQKEKEKKEKAAKLKGLQSSNAAGNIIL